MLSRWPLPAVEIQGARAFGLSTVQLLRLGTAPVHVTVDFYEPKVPLDPTLSIAQRAAVFEVRHMARLSETLAFWPGLRGPRVVAYEGRPSHLTGTLSAGQLRALAALPVTHITVDKINGRPAPRSRASRTRLYSIRCRLVRQIEGQSRGLQVCEERIVLVRATSEERARDKLWKSEQDDDGYLHDDGVGERWLLEEILDVCEPFIYALNDDIIEVYYRLFDRRITKDRAWSPRSSAARQAGVPHQLATKHVR
ncbi:MAG: DUF4288 domain-containing protein [Deltaproteobacteria bacterium]|nr:DUF4288 domain-containing protein [Deltaproteobacteria bacterium]